jgi:hypothetical protein
MVLVVMVITQSMTQLTISIMTPGGIVVGCIENQ